MVIRDAANTLLGIYEQIDTEEDEEHAFLILVDTSHGEYKTVELQCIDEYVMHDQTHIAFSAEIVVSIIRCFKKLGQAVIVVHNHPREEEALGLGFSEKDLSFEHKFAARALEEGYTQPIFFMVVNRTGYLLHSYDSSEECQLYMPYENIDISESEIKVCTSNDGNALYYRKCNKAFAISKKSAELFCEAGKQEMLYAESLAWKYLIYHKAKELPCSALTPTPCFGEAKKIYRLQLMVSTLCNLDCKYCYASGGTYKTQGALMQREQIDKIMEQIRILQIKEISNVFFFGGEPLLNIEVIEYVCDQFEELLLNGDIAKRPHYTTVTNGTIYNGQIRDVLLKKDIYVTVSIDGPQNIHDRLRCDKNGKGSYSEVAENIHRMRQDGVHVVALEATYTTLHQKANLSKKDTILFLRQTFGIDNVVCAFCEGDADLSPRDIEPLDIDEERAWEIMQCLAREGSIPAESCLAAIQSMTILPDGDIYPCHRLIGNTEYRMFQNNQFADWETSDQYCKVSQLFRNVDKVRNKKCQRCWANRLCIMCPIALLDGGASSCNSELKAVEFTIAQV